MIMLGAAKDVVAGESQIPVVQISLLGLDLLGLERGEEAGELPSRSLKRTYGLVARWQISEARGAVAASSGGRAHVIDVHQLQGADVAGIFVKLPFCMRRKDFNGLMDAGQVWTYRERVRSADCPVERTKYLQAAPKGNKCLVRFLDRDGREEWVPRGRLIVLWDEREAWLENERRMAAVVEVSAHAYETPQFEAVSSLLSDWGFIDGIRLGWSQDELCTVQIEELSAVCEQLTMDPDDLRREPLAFTNDDGLFVGPWSLAVKIARRVAELHGEAAMEQVTEEEYKIELEMVHGYTFTVGRDGEEHWVSPDRLKDRHMKQLIALNIVREWCGKEVIERLDELEALREEVRRLGRLVERAIAELRRCGQGATAATMETDLGVPVSRLVLRGHKKRRGG
jgi:hypothetical protein